MWPAYFSAWEKAPPPFDIAIGVEAYAETMQSVTAELPGLAARLRGVRVPTRFVHGALSPMPVTASTDSAELLGAEVDVVADCGHFLWLEAPGLGPPQRRRAAAGDRPTRLEFRGWAVRRCRA